MAAKSRQELYEIAKNFIQIARPDLTDFEEGSINDAIIGAVATIVSENQDITIAEFRKTTFAGARGPEETGGEDELENLAVDHFGEDFARPGATKSVGIAKFVRPNDNAGNCLIQAGTIVKTVTDPNGQSRRFETLLDVTMTGTAIYVSARAIDAGPKGNIGEGGLAVIESTLTDPSITVTNEDEFSGGAPEQDNSTYRQTIKNLLQQLRGSTAAAIKAKALTVAGVVSAEAHEEVIRAIQWDPANNQTIGEPFLIARAKLYIADANGGANQALLDVVDEVVDEVRAAGVRIESIGSLAYVLNWSAEVELNPLGPNFAGLQGDPTPIEESMEAYLASLAIASGFDRSDARDAILAIWGPDGSNDVTDFTTISPSGDIAPVAATKIIPGAVEIV
jgi:hypothetical protein